PSNFSKLPELASAAMLLLAFAGAEAAIEESDAGSYDRTPPADMPVVSSTRQTRFLALSATNHHLVKVLVESMGAPNDPDLRKKLLARFYRPDIQRLYTVQVGMIPFFGATTNAEMRGLCNRWGDYHGVVDGFHPECIPARLAQRGYHTV